MDVIDLCSSSDEEGAAQQQQQQYESDSSIEIVGVVPPPAAAAPIDVSGGSGSSAGSGSAGSGQQQQQQQQQQQAAQQPDTNSGGGGGGGDSSSSSQPRSQSQGLLGAVSSLVSGVVASVMGSSTSAAANAAGAGGQAQQEPQQQEQQGQGQEQHQPLSAVSPKQASAAVRNEANKAAGAGAAGSPSEAPPPAAKAAAVKAKPVARPTSIPPGGYDPAYRYRLRRTGLLGIRENIALPWYEEGKDGIEMIVGRKSQRDNHDWAPGKPWKVQTGLLVPPEGPERLKQKLVWISREHISLRVDTRTGRFILKNISRFTFVTIKRSALGWGGTPSEVDLDKGEETEIRLGDVVQLDAVDKINPEATWMLEQDDPPLPPPPAPAKAIKKEKGSGTRASTGSFQSMSTQRPPSLSSSKGTKRSGRASGASSLSDGVGGDMALEELLDGAGGGGGGSKKRPSPTGPEQRRLRARKGGKAGEEDSSLSDLSEGEGKGKGKGKKGAKGGARLRKAQDAAKLGAAAAGAGNEEDEEEDWSDGEGTATAAPVSRARAVVGLVAWESGELDEDDAQSAAGASVASAASRASGSSRGTTASSKRGGGRKGKKQMGRCVFCQKEFKLDGEKDQAKLAAHTADCQRLAAKRAKEEAAAAMEVAEDAEEDEQEEEEEMAVTDPSLEGPAHRNSTGSAASASKQPPSSSAAAAAATAPAEEEAEPVVVLPEGWAPEELPSNLVSSLSACLTVQDPSFVLAVLEAWVSHTYHQRPSSTARKKPAGRLPPLRLVPEILHANGSKSTGKGLFNTNCPLRAQAFARMLHATQAAFPAHAIAGAWRPADIKLFNDTMSGIFDKDPRKARSRALALGWLTAMFGAQSADIRKKCPQPAAADRALAASILGSLIDSYVAEGDPSAGLRAETRGAVDSALHVCGKPVVLRSATEGRTATLRSAPGRAGADAQRWLLWAEGAEALAARFAPRLALLALEAYGALLRTKYSRAEKQTPPLELVEQSLVKRAEALVIAQDDEEEERSTRAGGGKAKKAGGGAKQFVRRVEETKEALRRVFYRPMPPPAARRLLGTRYHEYEQAALGPLFAEVRAFEEGQQR